MNGLPQALLSGTADWSDDTISCVHHAAPAAYRQKGLASRMAPTEVLVIDDDEAIREIIVDCLHDAGYTVYEAPDGQPALERLRTHPAGLVVLLDLWMPGMDGYALLQVVAEEALLTTRHTFILCSAVSKTLPLKVVALLKQLNATSLPKPFDLDELLATVRQAASKLH